MTSGDDQLHQRWSFTAPSATLPGARPHAGALRGTALRSSLVGASTATGTSLRPAPLPARPDVVDQPRHRSPGSLVIDDEPSVAETFLRAVREPVAEPFVGEDVSPAPASTASTPVPVGDESDGAGNFLARARARKVGGVSLLALLVVLGKLVTLVLSMGH